MRSEADVHSYQLMYKYYNLVGLTDSLVGNVLLINGSIKQSEAFSSRYKGLDKATL